MSTMYPNTVAALFSSWTGASFIASWLIRSSIVTECPSDNRSLSSDNIIFVAKLFRVRN